MSRHRSRADKPIPEARRARLVAQAAGHTLQSHAVGALPLINGILNRLRLRVHLQATLPAVDGRVVVPAATGLPVLLKNVLLSREPLYGIADWGARQVPYLLGVTGRQIEAFNDDRTGRCLDRLFDADCGVVAHNVQRHSLTIAGQESNVLVTQLLPVQQTILKLLRHSSEHYSR